MNRKIDTLSIDEENIFNDIIAERDRQDEMYGVKDHPPTLWLSILMKQLGQASDCVIGSDRDIDIVILEKQLTQLAAVAVAWREIIKEKH